MLNEEKNNPTEEKKSSKAKIIFGGVIVLAIVIFCLFKFGIIGSNMDSRTKAFLSQADDYVTDSLPANASKIGIYADTVKCYVFYVINDEQGSKYDNESDYFPIVYVYDINKHINSSIDLSKGVYTKKGDEANINTVKCFEMVNDNKNIILAGTNGDNMGRGLVALNYDVTKGEFKIICTGVGEKIFIEDGIVRMQVESASQKGGSTSNSSYSFYNEKYDLNGNKVSK